MFTWGMNYMGKLGTQLIQNDKGSGTPVKVEHFYASHVTNMSIGYSHMGAVTGNETVTSWFVIVIYF